MSSIRQYQRRAIEALARANVLRSMEIKFGVKFFLDGHEVFFGGISPGVGSCSDMHDVDFAVFSSLDSDAVPLPEKPKSVAGAVFVRGARTKVERQAIGDYRGQLVLVVEALRHYDVRPGLTRLYKVGKKKSYVSIAG